MFPSSYFAPTYFAPKYYPPITQVIVNVIKRVFCIGGQSITNSIDAAQVVQSIAAQSVASSNVGQLFDYTLQGIKSSYSLQGIKSATSILAQSIEPISNILSIRSYDIVGSEQALSSVAVKDSFNLTAQETGNTVTVSIKIEC